MVFDAGKASSADNEFFEKSKQCLSRILERKVCLYLIKPNSINKVFQILVHSVDQIALILVGSDESEESYVNVFCPFEFRLASWDMVRFVRNQLKPTKNKSDWLSGIVLAADKLGWVC